MELIKRMVSLAGCTKDNFKVLKGSESENFEEVLDALTVIHNCKANQYGNYVENHKEDTPTEAIFQVYSDVKRKYVRLKAQAEKSLDMQGFDDDVVVETLTDLAVYSILGLLLLEDKRTSKDDDLGAKWGNQKDID